MQYFLKRAVPRYGHRVKSVRGARGRVRSISFHMGGHQERESRLVQQTLHTAGGGSEAASNPEPARAARHRSCGMQVTSMWMLSVFEELSWGLPTRFSLGRLPLPSAPVFTARGAVP